MTRKSIREVLGLATEYFVSSDMRIPEDPGTHKTYILLALLFLMGPFFLNEVPGDHNALAFFGIQLPPTCPAQRLFHTQCPGCGMTHSFVYFVHGRIRESVSWNRVGIPLYIFFAYQIIFRIRILRNSALTRSSRVAWFQHYLGLSVVSMLIINWAAGLFLGSNGS